MKRFVCCVLFIYSVPAVWAQKLPEVTRLVTAQTEVPEESLLDVNILVFDPGLPKGDEYAKEKKAVFPGVRKSESRYIPTELMQTLQQTGYWGAVRVVPRNVDGGEVRVDGRIIYSTGFKRTLDIRVTDATGKQWLRKKFKRRADPRAYNKGDDLWRNPYTYLNNEIANAILEARQKQTPEHLRAIRQVDELRFAGDIAPDSFNEYLKTRPRNRGDRYSVLKLPAEGDPMMARVMDIRDRDAMLVDTLTAHYQDFGRRMDKLYGDWQAASYKEEKELRKMRRDATIQQVLGALLIVGAVVNEADSSAEAGAETLAVMAGSSMVQAGTQQRQAAKIYMEGLKELAASLDGEVEPMLVDLEGRTLKLTGTAETQYDNWRNLLRKIFADETGLPVDPNTGQPVDADTAAKSKEGQ
ncbi:MAG: hypothetical protein QNK37_30015 [Acidobacteriota bacterium]|nr:hypothetical protein [Acidobacteriota bacterium]